MIIILEGPRGVGKTTTIHELAKRLHADVVDYDPEPRETLKQRLLDYIDTDRLVIHDRFHVSEWVYSVAFERGDPGAVLREMKEVDAALRGRGKTFVLYNSLAEVQRRRRASGKVENVPLDVEASLFQKAWYNGFNVKYVLADAFVVDRILKELKDVGTR